MPTLTSLYIGYLVPGSTLIPLTAGIVYYKKLNAPLRSLLIYIGLSLLTNIYASVTAGYHINNLPGLHIYTALELITLLFYYRLAFGPGKISYWLSVIMVAFPLLCVINFSFFQSIFTFNSYTRPLEAMIIIVVTGIYLSAQANFKKRELITASGRIVASGLLIYFCSSLFLFLFSNILHIKAGKFVIDIIYNLHATFVLIMYLFFYTAILNGRNKR